MASRKLKNYILPVFSPLLIFFLIYKLDLPCSNSHNGSAMIAEQKFILGKDSKKYVYNRSLPLIFIGGLPRSGASLLQVMLDDHPDVSCGTETILIPLLLNNVQRWVKTPSESNRLQEAGITEDILDNAVASFALEILARHVEPAPRLCNKDSFALRSAVYFHSLFPKSKFILLVRDGRAVVHSIISRKLKIKGYDLNNYRKCLIKWNSAISAMYAQCISLDPDICMPVHYEQVVLQPRPSMERILKFLDIPWNDSALHYEHLVDKHGEISTSRLDRSSDQVVKPITIEALTKWVGQIPKDVLRDMPSVAPMLSILGYNPKAVTPDYTKFQQDKVHKKN